MLGAIETGKNPSLWRSSGFRRWTLRRARWKRRAKLVRQL